jgi:hypothetical protein
MIDDYATTMELIEQMKSQVPIPVYAGKALIRTMRKNGVKIRPKQTLHIEHIHYLGNEGGIACAITGMGKENTNYVCSLTHLRVKEPHPLAKSMKAYQRERQNKLTQQSLGGPAQFVVTPKRRKGK